MRSAALLWLALAAPATPPPQVPSEPGPAHLLAVRSEASSVQFQVRMRPRRYVSGRFGEMAGSLLRRDDGLLEVRMRLAASSVEFPGRASYGRFARSGAFFDAEHHPLIEFDSRPFPQALLQRGGELQGSLTLRGVRREVAFRLAPGGCTRPGLDCDLEVAGSVDRDDFDMGALGLLLDDEVRFHFRLRLGLPS
ncbi:YceI family protein [Coralloluteibacterium stylophorae]|uniref:YceI family protein n=1 Tax=Coralloluteibacterium stylophorae TaxID=1776034 RepID=UPI0021F077B8|nr:YceI family protein [Coralloluteibacterium stylophorae]